MATRVAAAGGGNWTAGATWVGGVAPTAADDAQLTSTSGNVTADAGSVCRSLDCNTYTGALSIANSATALAIGDATAGAGNIALRLVSGMTLTLVGSSAAISFISTSTTVQTITSGGKSLPDWNVNGVGSKYQVADAMTIGVTLRFTLTSGEIDFNGQTVSLGLVNMSGAVARAIKMNGATITMTGGGNANIWNATTTTNLTVNDLGTSGAIVFSGTGSTLGVPVFIGGGLTYNNVSWNHAFGAFQITSANTFVTLSITGGNSATNDMRLAGNQVVTGVLTLSGFSVSSRLCIRSTALGTSRTITAASDPVTNGFVDLVDITAAGAGGSWTDTGWGVLGVTNITGATPVNTYWVGGTGNSNDATKYASTSGGTANTQRAPLLQDSAFYDANSGTGTITMNSGRFGSINFTNTALTAVSMAGGFAQRLYGGDFILPTGFSVSFGSFADIVSWTGRGSHTLSLNGTTLSLHAFAVSTTGTYTLGSDYNSSVAFSKAGTFNTANYAMTVLTFTNTSGNTDLGSSVIILTVTSASACWTWTAGTLTAGSSTIWSNNSTTANTQTFAGGGQTYHNVQISRGGGAIFSITGNNTFKSLLGTGTGAKSVRFANGSTTVLGSSFFFRGDSANRIVIITGTSGTIATISSAFPIDTDWLDIRDITGAGTAIPFYAGANSVNTSNNTNITFTERATDGSAMAGSLV